jgi:hypothetical protein
MTKAKSTRTSGARTRTPATRRRKGVISAVHVTAEPSRTVQGYRDHRGCIIPPGLVDSWFRMRATRHHRTLQIASPHTEGGSKPATSGDQ